MNETESLAGEIIELKRYPSRKLYNKTASRYVKLSDVADMVRRGATVRVEDSESGEDVTRQVLLQIIMDQEAEPEGSILPLKVMMDMIRAHNGSAADVVSDMLDQSFAAMRAYQADLANKMAHNITAPMTSPLTNPWAAFAPEQFKAFQEQFQQSVADFWMNEPRRAGRADAPGQPKTGEKAESGGAEAASPQAKAGEAKAEPQAGASGGKPGPKAKAAKPERAELDELAALRKRMDELERKLSS